MVLGDHQKAPLWCAKIIMVQPCYDIKVQHKAI